MVDESNNGCSNSTSTDSHEPTVGEATKADYAIGYGRPPKTTQFKKGQSGNPKGKKPPEEIDDIRIVMEDVLAELVNVREGGKVRLMSREEAIMHAELMNALNGDPRATAALFKRGQKCGLFSKSERQNLLILTESGGDDGKILRMFHAEQEALRRSAADIDPGTCNKTTSDNGH